MARLPRIWAPHLAEHVVVRGNDRQAIFRSDGDRVFFHRCMAVEARRFGVSVHAYVLMTNHVHVLATAPAPGVLSKLFQTIGRRYVPYFNYLYGRTGTLWEGRFRACPVESDRYLMACQRYIELNPVRAGICAHPADFPWSSHRHYVHGVPDDLVTAHPVFMALGDEASRVATYRLFFEGEPAPETLQVIRECLNKGWALGGSDFACRLRVLTGRSTAPKSRGKRKPQSVRRAGSEERELTQFQSDPMNGMGELT